MSSIKGWSTGSIGNSFPDHSDRGNPNTKGLVEDPQTGELTVPGVEGYIEEDIVDAKVDNRPLKNLVYNDITIENNLIDVASEVDYGVFKGKLDEFEVTVLPSDPYPNPELPSETIQITPLRINSGSAIIDGQVTQVGQQQIAYFVKDDNTYLFPPYEEFDGEFVIEIVDQDYDGDYVPVWTRVPEGLPDNFTDYQIEITNTYTSGDPDRQALFDVYRDWEDIVPFQYHNEDIVGEDLEFEYDTNFGQFSEGYWLESGGTQGTAVDKVTVQKDILVKDKILNNFILNGATGKYEQEIITDGIFFDNITWQSTSVIDDSDLKDLYAHTNGDVYFINEGNSENIYMLTNGAFVLKVKQLSTSLAHATGLKQIDNLLFIIGWNGLVEAFDLNNDFDSFSTTAVDWFDNQTITEEIKDVYVWDNKLWVAGEKNLWYTDYSSFDISTSTFTVVDIENQLAAISGEPVIEHINKIMQVRGNTLIDSSLQNEIDNVVLNPSFEFGGVGNLPEDWSVEDDGAGQATLEVQPSGWNGSFKAVLQLTPTENNAWASQDIELDLAEGDVKTLSVYLQSVDPNSDEIRIIELNDSDGEITRSTETYTLAGGEGWTRFNLTHTVDSDDAVKLRIEIACSSQSPLQIDAVQLEDGNIANQFVEMFDYLFVGYTKAATNALDPPFALLDVQDRYHPKFYRAQYGDIKSINDAFYKGGNQVLFIDDLNLYSMTFLNDFDAYDRVSIKNISKDYPEFDFRNRVESLETLMCFNDRTFIGGTVQNKVIKVAARNTDDITIKFENAGVGENLLDLIGENILVRTSLNTPARREFKFIDKLYEASGSTTSLGRYVPNTQYSMQVIIEETGDTVSVTTTSPAMNDGPWTLDQIVNDLFGDLDSISLDFIYETSFILSEGLYSFGKRDITKHFRGDIHKIVSGRAPDDLDSLYMIRGNQIYRSKPDPNILKRDNGTYPIESDPDYFHEWDLYDSDFDLTEYVNQVNEELQFSDNVNNRDWIDIPVNSGYKLVPGTVRLKTNADTEVGFTENIDYVVDYENAKVIRHDGDNLIANTDFRVGNTGTQPQDWSIYYDHPDGGVFEKFANNQTFTQFSAELYPVGPNTTLGVAYQVYIPPTMNVGDTYTASVYVMAQKDMSPTIRITECDGSNVTNLTSGYDSSQYIHTIDSTLYGQWIRINVSHTITDSSSDRIRFELQSDSYSQLWFVYSQLERNPIPTPYIREQARTRIDPDMHVWVDFAESRELQNGVDYTFDTSERKVILESMPTNNKSYYFSYKYDRIFNPHIFGDSLPQFRVTYDTRDDYFLYKAEGRIWAINQFFAMLSLDEENELTVTYSYHYPRVDLIKIRNTPDEFGNYIYIVKGQQNENNPYRPYDIGTEDSTHVFNVSQYDIQDKENNDVLYSINVTKNDFSKNDIYDRRIWIDKDNSLYNISLSSETVAYFPFSRSFNATNGLSPLNFLESSKIVPIIKNFTIYQNEEVGAYHEGYQFVLRDKQSFPGASTSISVDPVNGSDLTGLGTTAKPYKTIGKAVSVSSFTDSNNRRNDIIIENDALITEVLEIDKPYPIYIWARSYFNWRGALQNRSSVYIQGAYFIDTEIYPLANIYFYYCTFDDSTVNEMITNQVYFSNCEFLNCHNSPIRVNDSLTPSPFVHPYLKSPDPTRDDGVAHGSNPDIATSDTESIHPGDSFESLATQPFSEFTFFRCLIHDTTDHIVEYDPTPDWPATFIFNKCTIAHNKNLFVTEKFNVDILYSDCILFENGETRSSETKYFDSNSDIELQKNFIDFSTDTSVGGPQPSEFNFGSGQVEGRGTGVGGEGADPLFIGPSGDFYDYHLRSTARGFSVDSPCLGESSDNNDLGCWDEVRQRTDVDIPKNIFTYIAFISEGVRYPIVLNSEKITFNVEYKPTESLSASGVLFDTRVHEDEVDYIVFAYNNNDPDDPSIEQNPSNDPTNPYRFRLIVSNRDRQYVVVSPILIQSDADFQTWHKLSWTVNYEQTFNPKSTFDEKDKLQNIVAFFHNDYLAVESYIKYDMNRDDDAELIEGRNQDETNDWNFNNISEIVTLGAEFDGTDIMKGYYSELRIDNRFTDRKILDAWNRKKVPFNDPYTQVNQNPLVKSFDQRILTDFWSLKSRFNIGAKGNRFLEGSTWKYSSELGEPVWVLNSPTANLLSQPGFNGIQSALVYADVEIVDAGSGGGGLGAGPHTFTNDIQIQTTNSRNSDDNSGIVLAVNGETVNSKAQVESMLDTAFANVATPTNIFYRLNRQNLLEFFTTDGRADSIEVTFGSQPDADALGFESATSKTGLKDLGDYTIDILDGDITGRPIDDFNFYTTSDPQFTELTDNAIVLTREDLVSPSSLALHQNVTYEETSFVYSAYIYYDEEELSNDLIKFYYNDGSHNKSDWTRIERIVNGWWLVSKTISFTGTGNIDVGITFSDILAEPQYSQTGTIVIDAVQWEKDRSYESPFVETQSPNDDKLIISRSLINPTRGTIFFRAKPRFNFYDTSERILFEFAGDDGNIPPTVSLEKSFRIIYYFSTEKNRGIFSFRINDPDGTLNTTWDTEIVERFFYQWHNFGITYDFESQRFVYFFDYFKYTVDAATDAFRLFTNVYFGLDTAETPESSADIAIKDIVIANQPVSDIDILTWVGTYEFYKESLNLRVLEEYNQEITDLISQVTGLSGSTVNLFNRLDLVEAEILDLQNDITVINNGITSITGSLSSFDGRITDTENDISNIQANVGTIQTDLEFMQDGNTSTWSQALASTQQYNIYENREDINDLFNQVAAETSARLLADQTIRADLASNTSSYGAGLIGVQGVVPSSPLDAQFTQTTVEGVLRELAGSGRTTENIKTNADQIASITSITAGVAQQLNDMQDGDTGSWTQTLAQNSGYNIYENRQDLAAAMSDISDLQTDLSNEITDRENADQAIRDDLVSQALAKGASLIGINDLAGIYTATEVEAALAEVKTLADGNYTRSTTNESDITSQQIAIVDIATNLGYALDGVDGSSWTNNDWNLVEHENRLDALETSQATQSSDISDLQTDLAQEIIDRGSEHSGFVNNLADDSTGSTYGGSLVGYDNSTSGLSATTVQDAIDEIGGEYSIDIENIVYVAKNGSDSATGVTLGTIANPYLTVQAAIDSITDASSSKYYIVYVMPGTYEENLTLKDYVGVVGISKEGTRVRSATSGTHSWTTTGGRTFFKNIGLGGASQTLSLTHTPTSPGGVSFWIDNCQVGVMTANFLGGGIDYVQVRNDCSFSGLVTIHSAAFTAYNSVFYGGLTLDSQGFESGNADGYGSVSSNTVKDCMGGTLLLQNALPGNDVWVEFYNNYSWSTLTSDGNTSVFVDAQSAPDTPAQMVSLNGGSFGFTDNAFALGYNNSTSGLTATTVQDAIDEVDVKIDQLVLAQTTGIPVDTPATGTIRFDPTGPTIYVYDGSTWRSTTLT